MLKIAILMIKFLVFFYVALLLLLYIFQRKLIYFPDTSTYTQSISPFNNVDIPKPDGKTFKSLFYKGEEGWPCIVFFHGNAGRAEHRIPKVLAYIDKGYSVLLVEYSGYGLNQQDPISEQNLYVNAEASRSWLEKNYNFKNEDLIIYGESIGTGVAVDLASKIKTPKALILEMPFISLQARVKELYSFIPVSLLLKDKFLNDRKIQSVKSPKLFLHGYDDTVIPIQHAKKLYDLANLPKEYNFYENGTHDNLYYLGASVDILDFLAGLDANNKR